MVRKLVGPIMIVGNSKAFVQACGSMVRQSCVLFDGCGDAFTSNGANGGFAKGILQQPLKLASGSIVFGAAFAHDKHNAPGVYDSGGGSLSVSGPYFTTLD
jgi:hypothetical protein